ncbi:MAG: hypothetical protein ACRED1_06785, partial [Limisphaerales bacterium]
MFLRDLQADTTSLVSLNTNGGAGDGACYSPAISDDGRYVLFTSTADNLVPGSLGNSGGNLFWRDLQSGTNRAITSYSGSTTVQAINAAMTPDGQRVAFSAQINYSTAAFYVWDAVSNSIIYTNTAS